MGLGNQVKRIMQPSASERLKLIREKAGKISQQKMADIIDVPVSRIKDVESGKNNITIDLGLKLEGISNFNFKWIMTGEGAPSSLAEDAKTTLDLFKGFNDKNKALEVYLELIELERLHPEALRQVETFIKETIKTLSKVIKNSSSSDRRKNDRRVKNDPGKAPDGRDRRSGKDRRKAGVKM